MTIEEMRAKMIKNRKNRISRTITGKDLIRFIQENHLEDFNLDEDTTIIGFMKYDDIEDINSNITDAWIEQDGRYIVKYTDICDRDIEPEDIHIVNSGKY